MKAYQINVLKLVKRVERKHNLLKQKTKQNIKQTLKMKMKI